MLKKGNPLPYLKETIDFEQFRDILEPVFGKQDRKSNAGRKPLDPVFMFRVLFLQRLYGLGDAQAEYQIKDRTSFRDFLGIACMEDVPDEKTIWKYKDELAKAGTFDLLFKRFNDYLATLGLILTEGKIIDASFVIAPRQRNTPEENEKIKKGEGDELWSDKPNKKRQKDIDASWTQKGGEDFFGYKVSAKVDGKSKFVKKIVVTTASPHDSKMFPDLMDESDRGQVTFADSAYVGQEETLQKYGLKDEICEKGYRGNPLTDEQREENRKKSVIRSRVEHVFGFMEGAMHGLTVRTIGIARATAHIFLKCLTYNMFRYEQFVRNGIR